MNPLGIHALVWVGDWTEPSAQLAIESSRKAGFDIIEIPLLDPATVDPAMTRRLLDDNGLEATCSLGLSADTDVSSEDEKVVARGRDLLAAAVDAAHGFGATHMVGVVYSMMGKYTAPMSALSRRHSVESMAWLHERTAQAGIALSLEVVNRYETNVANTAREMLALIDDTGADIGVHLDSYHMNIEENGMADPVHATGDRFRYLHIGESHRGRLGTGNVNFDELFGTVREVGYQGPVTFESFSSAVVSKDLTPMLGLWRNLWDDGMDLATHARSFMAERLEG
jgi:D-psicose/D-tagatose/L-ribulose 3-epimerase